jgi:hypothetical protein
MFAAKRDGSVDTFVYVICPVECLEHAGDGIEFA